MKSHLFRFFTWLCMKISVVSRRLFCVSISSTFYTSTFFGKWNISTSCQLYALGVPDVLRQLTSPLSDQGYLYFCVKMTYWVPCIYGFRAHKCYSTYLWFLENIDIFSRELLKSWLSAFWDPGHCSDGSFRTRLFWCCRAAAKFGSQSPHQGT